jgi:hypothetical protein
VPKSEAHRYFTEIESGRSSGGFGIDVFGIFYSGRRTYYTKEEIWLCHDCYQSRIRRQRNREISVIGGVAILSIAAFFFSGGMKNHRSLLTQLSTPTGVPLSLRCKVPTL